MSVTLPPPLAALVDELIAMPGACAVVLGGSRATGAADAGSDWDFGVYYRGDLDTAAIAARGTVHPPGSWGRIMNGGAWLVVDGLKVDVLLRDLDAVERWSEAATRGQFEIDNLLGYTAGCPTYSLLAERATGVTLRGSLPPVAAFPDELARAAPGRWRFCASFSLEHARMRAARGDVVGAVGQAARAVIEAAHARLCEQRVWRLNEKQILTAAGMADVQASFAHLPSTGDALVAWVDDLREALGALAPAVVRTT